MDISDVTALGCRFQPVLGLQCEMNVFDFDRNSLKEANRTVWAVGMARDGQKTKILIHLLGESSWCSAFVPVYVESLGRGSSFSSAMARNTE